MLIVVIVLIVLLALRKKGRRTIVVVPSTGCTACDMLLNAGVKPTRDRVPPSCYAKLKSKGIL